MDVENLFDNLEIDDPELKNKCFILSAELQSGKCTIVNLIEQLSSLLTNTSRERRELGVLILSEVLKSLPVDFLNPQQCEVISTFFIEKLKDHHQIVPVALKGILRIIEFNNFPKQHIPLILTTIFQNIACQQQQQGDRYNIYLIFTILLEKYTSDSLSLGVDLVYGIITSIEGERDPRNLLFLFKWIKSFVKVVPLGHLAEEMFEVLACYFPVDFKSPSNNTQITRDSLAEALCPSLCAIPEFGEYCIPLALEKLDSSLEIAKNDSLKLLEEGCENFSNATYMEFAYKIWSQLQKEIFTCNDSDEFKYLNVLTKIINKLSQASELDFKSFLKTIVDMMKGNLLPDTKHFQISSKTLVYIAKGSRYSSNYVLKEIGPILINTYNITKTNGNKAFILQSLVQLIKASLEYEQSVNLEEKDDLTNVISMCFLATLDASADLRCVGFNNLSNLIPYLSLDHRIKFYKNMQKFLIKPESDIVRGSIINSFRLLATFYGEEVKSHVINNVNIVDSTSLDLYLNALCELMSLKPFKELVANSLIERIGENVEWSNISFKNIKLLLEKNKTDLEILDVFFQKQIIEVQIEFSLKYLTANQVIDDVFINMATILKIIIGSRNREDQNQVLYLLEKVYNCVQFKEEFVILLSGLISNLHNDINIDYEIINNLFLIISKSQNEFVCNVAMQLIANIINKKTDDESLLSFLQDLKNHCIELFKRDPFKSILIISWISKALAMRNHSQTFSWIDLLLQLIEDYDHFGVAQGFKIILDYNYESMGNDSHCIKMPLYRQKVFTYIINKLMNEFPVTQQSKVTLFSSLLEYGPEQVVLLNFKKVSRLVLLCLEKSQEEHVLVVLLKIVKKFASIKNEVIEEHLEDFITRILNLSSFPGSMKVRIEALQCLVQFISSYPIYKLLPLKSQVLNHLALCTDDRKRLVRREAMEARSLWFLLDAPI